MLKLYSIFGLSILFFSVSFSQPTVDIQLVMTEAQTQLMSVGLDLSATNCIDLALGEVEAPPPPPPGAFHIIFDLAPYGCPALTVWKDYRDAPSFPFTGQIQHTLGWQRSAPGTAINIQYNLPGGATMTIRDAITGTLWTTGPLNGSGTTVIPGTGIPASLTSAHLIMDYIDIIPVELTSFTANVIDNDVQLDWTTATEINNQGFDIERQSHQLGSWEKIGFVPGFGTTTEPRSYSYTDQMVTSGKYSYRLKQVDYDGTFEYSNEVIVEVDFTPSDFILSQNFPNPFNPNTTIQFQIPNSSNVTLKIYDMLGQEVRTLFAGEVVPGKYSVDWNGLSDNGNTMSSGNYIYKLTAGDFVDTKQMILLK